MTRIHVIAEGQTEETFLRDVLVPHFAANGIYATVSILTTKRVADGPNHVGGVTSYAKFKYDIEQILRNPAIDKVTTLVDFYGLPLDFPGRNTVPSSSPINRVRHVEAAITADIDNNRFLCFLALHEFEALVFVNPVTVQDAFPETNCLSRVQAIRDAFDTPEDINDSPHTAPSKRLETLFGDEYQKTLHGPLITATTGLDKLRAECPHFNGWITSIESL